MPAQHGLEGIDPGYKRIDILAVEVELVAPDDRCLCLINAG